MTGVPLTRVVLREQVKDVLLERVLAGVYPPGSRLVETRIAQELGVSQAPVREALRDLEQLGLVESEPFRGCSVRELSIDELLEALVLAYWLDHVAYQLRAHPVRRAQPAWMERNIELVLRSAADALAE